MTTDIITIPICEESTLEQVLETMNQIDIVLERAKEAKANFKADLLAWIQASKPFEFGGKKYFVGKKKKTKCVNVAACIESLLDKLDGDFDEFVQLLASQPIKHGAAREVLGDDWTIHFETTTEDVLELKKIPTNLLPKGRNKQ